MEIELRADGVRITGYVNVTEKKSWPVITPHGKAIEEIEPRAQAPWCSPRRTSPTFCARKWPR